MLRIKIKPITTWVGNETKYPRRSQFRQTYSNTKKILEKELSFLDVYGEPELEMFIHQNDLRQDGELRANSKPYKHGVKLSFLLITRRFTDPKDNQRKVVTKTLTYPCDVFDDWQDNLRAIALSLEALRKVERYGVFKFQDVVARLALPSADGKISTRETAAEFIAKHSGIDANQILSDNSVFIKAYRKAALKLHPDKSNDSTDFIALQDARKILEKG